MNGYLYAIGFLEGILTFISPCILPLLPVYFFYLAGISSETDRERDSSENDSIMNKRFYVKYRLVLNATGFVLGFSGVFITLGAAATSLGHFLRDNLDLFRKISGIIIVVFGFNFMGVFNLGFLNKEMRFDFKAKELKFIGSILFGMVFGFGWTPCVGAFLGSVLIMAGNSETLKDGIFLLFIYSLGLGIPFMLSSILFSKIKGTFICLKKNSKVISIISGIVLIVTGVLVYADLLKYL